MLTPDEWHASEVWPNVLFNRPKGLPDASFCLVLSEPILFALFPLGSLFISAAEDAMPFDMKCACIREQRC